MKTTAPNTSLKVKTILFATDFSDAARKAQTYAMNLASRFAAKLLILHAKEPPNYSLPADSWRNVDDAATRNIQELKTSLPHSHPGLKTEFCVGEGTAWQVVEAVLGKNKVDLLVLGTRGRTGIGKLLLGSQAEEIFRRTLCPVLTVGPHSQELMGEEKELREVLYATDFSPESQMAAPYAISVALALGAHLSLLHVVEEPKVGELIHPEDVISSSKRLLVSLIPEDTEFWREPRCYAEAGEPKEKILEVADRVHASLIVLGVRKPTGIPGAATHLGTSLAHKIVAAALCPVLTVKG